MVPHRSVGASLALLLPLLISGCGQPDGDGSVAGADGSRSRSAAPALAPEGPTSRTVAYRCTSGREETIAVDVPDVRDLARTLNRIQPCEYDRGFDRGTVTIDCDAGPVTVPLRGRDGSVLQPGEARLEC